VALGRQEPFGLTLPALAEEALVLALGHVGRVADSATQDQGRTGRVVPLNPGGVCVTIAALEQYSLACPSTPTRNAYGN
jgi:hypothetical protein